MRGSTKSCVAVFLLILHFLHTAAREECEEFGQTRGLFKLCKKVESQKTQSSSMFNKILEIEKIQNWYLANKEALESIIGIATSLSDHKKVQQEKDHDQDMKLSSIDGKVEAVKDHFFKVLKEQALNEAILDKKTSMESDALKEEIRTIKKGISELESRLSANTILLETKEKVTLETFAKISETVTELNNTFIQKMKAIPESHMFSPVTVESPPYFTSDRSLEGKLSDVATSLRNQMANLRSQSESELFNLTSFVEERLQTISTNVETRLNGNVALVRDSIFNASSAFIEDLELLRQLLSNTSNTVAYLSGRDLITVRSVEELKSTGRRQDAILQTLSKQLQDLQHGMQDQLQTVRNTFQSTMVDIYQKISDRQNQMTQRMTSLVDEFSTVKTRVRNIMAAMLVPTLPITSTVKVITDDFDSNDETL